MRHRIAVGVETHVRRLADRYVFKLCRRKRVSGQLDEIGPFLGEGLGDRDAPLLRPPTNGCDLGAEELCLPVEIVDVGKRDAVKERGERLICQAFALQEYILRDKPKDL